jgi:predicted nucleic acid-binding protein
VLVVDTGPLLATADRSDKDHAACRELLEGDEGPLVTTAMVIAETGYLIDRQLGPAAEAALYAAIAAGQIEVAGPGAGDWERIGELVTTYASMPLGGTDASVIALAERLGATRIATLDRRHFTVVRPRHAAAFTLLPA